MKSRLTVCFALIVSLFLAVSPMLSHAGVSLNPLDHNESEDDYLGISVSVSGNDAIIGADGDNQSAGAAYVFSRISDDAWEQQQKLTAGEDASPSDKFGASVSIFGNYAITGAPYNDDKASNAGAAYIFYRSAAGWARQGKLSAKDASSGDFFGGSVSMTDNYAIVGAAYDDDNGSESGSAYIFRRDGAQWSQMAKLTPNDGAGGDYFGVSVSIHYPYAIVGAHLNKDPGSNISVGAAYIFKYEAGAWVQNAKLMADDGAQADCFGQSVAISGQYAIIGAEGDDDNGPESGAAYIFQLETWLQQAKLVPPNGMSGDHFGKSVSISGGRAAIGAHRDDEAGENAGAMYIFSNVGGTWTLQEKQTMENAADGDLFGNSVSISGDYAIAGAPGVSGNAGSAYIHVPDDGIELPPNIQNPGDQTIPQGESTDIRVTITDPDTSVGNLIVTASSNNTTLIPNVRIALSEGTTWVLTLTSSSGPLVSSTARITVSAKDPENPAQSISFNVTVNDPPVVEGLSDSVTIYENIPAELEFTVGNSDGEVTLSATSSNTSLVPVDNIVFTESDTGYEVTITPVSGMFGSADITVKATDTSDGDITSKTFTLTVNPAFVISGIPSEMVTNEDVPVSVNFTVTSQTAVSEFDVSALWLSSAMSEGDISITDTDTGHRLTVTPPLNEFGSARINVSVRNSEGITTTSFILEVTPVNDPPVISGPGSETVTMNEDASEELIFTVGDVDSSLSQLKLTGDHSDMALVSDIRFAFGTGKGTERTMTITPDGYGTAKITVTVSDGLLESETTFTLDVNARPDITGLDGVQTIQEDTPKDFLLEVSDPDDPYEDLTVTAVSSDSQLIPNDDAHIRLSGSGADRSLSLTPGKDQSGVGWSTEITVTVTDDNGAQKDLQFFVTVSPVNDPPEISWIGPQQGTEDVWTDDLEFTVTDVEGGILSLSAVSAVSTLVPNDSAYIRINGIGGTSFSNYVAAGYPTPMSLSFLPLTDKYGVTEITVTVTDSEGLPDSVRFPLTITDANDPPEISDIGPQTTDEDTSVSGISFTVSDSEPGSLSLSVSSDNPALMPPGNVTLASQVTVEANVTEFLTLSLKPAANQSGTAEITVYVDDGIATVSDTFTLTVNPVNDPPEVSNIEKNLTITEDTSEKFSFTVSDPDTSADNLYVSVTSSNISLVPNQYAYLHVEGSGTNRILSVKSAKDADTNTFGTSDITVTVNDGEGGETQERVFLRVTSVNDSPVIKGVPLLQVNEGDSYLFTPDASDIDNEADELIFSIVHKPSWAMFDELSGTLSGTPGDLDLGKTTGIVITVADPQGESDSLPSFDIEVLNVNDLPQISDIGNQVADEDTSTDPIRFTVQDLEGGRLLISARSDDISLIPDNAIDIGGYGANYVLTTLPGEERELSLTLTPAANQHGTTTIHVSVNDGQGGVTEMPFYVMVRPVNDAPEVSIIPNQSTEECTAESASCGVEVTFTVSDPEGGTLRITTASDDPLMIPNSGFQVVGTDSEGRVNVQAGQPVSLVLKMTPAQGESGTASVTVSANDGDLSDATAFNLDVSYVNKLPLISDIQSQTTDEDTPVDVTFTITDVEGGAMPISVVSDDPVRVPNDAEHVSIIPEDQPGSGGFGPSYVMTLYPEGGNPATKDITVRIIPAENQTGPITFTVTVQDSSGTVAKDFFVTVRPLNDPPEIIGLGNQDTNEDEPLQNIAFSIRDSEGGMFEGGMLNLSVTSSDESLVPNDADHIVINTVPASGSGFGPDHSFKLSPGSEKNLTLSLFPASQASGKTQITVRADDGSGTGTAISETSFLFTVNYTDKAPVITGLYNRTASEDVPIDIIFTVSDAEGGALPISVASSDSTLVPNDPEHISINGRGPNDVLMMGPDDVQYPNLTITSGTNKFGSAKITVTVEDGDHTVEESFFITVNPKNDAPDISAIPNYRTSECEEDSDTCGVSVSFAVSDLEGGFLTISSVSSNNDLVPNDDYHIDLEGFGSSVGTDVNAGESVNMTLTLRPESGVIPSEDDFGNADITVTVEDEEGGKTSKTFTLRVDRINKPPRISGIYERDMKEDDPALDVIFRITDDEGGQFGINVTSSNTALFPEDYGHINVQGYGPQYVLGLAPGEPAADLILSLTPSPDQFGVSVITVTVTDGPHTVEETMIVNVKPANDGPSISAIPNQTTSEGQVTGPISFAVSDPEGGLLDIAVTSSDTVLVPEDDVHIDIGGFGMTHTVGSGPGETVSLSLTLLPADDQSGTAEITVTVTDRQGGTDSRTFKLMVDVVNEPPVLSHIFSQITNEDTAIEDIPFIVSDAEGGALTLSVASSDASLVPNDDIHIQITDGENTFGNSYILSLEGGESRNLALTIVPEENRSGSVQMSVTVGDGDVSTHKEFTLKVNSLNDPPVISSIPNQVTLMGTSTQPISFTVRDMEGGKFSGGEVEVSISSTNTALVPEDIRNIVIGEGFSLVHKVAALPGADVPLSLTITPAQGQVGETYITVKVDDGSGDALTATAEKSFHLEVQADPNPQLPIITGNANQSMNEDQSLDIRFTVSDADGGNSVISVTASNDILVPENAAHLSIDGFGLNHDLELDAGTSQDLILTVTPAADMYGETSLTVSAEQEGQRTEKRFNLVVNPVNDAPSLVGISDETMDENTLITVSFVAEDKETLPDDLDITITSSNTGLVPNNAMELSGSGIIRTLKITPAQDKTGETTITVRVSDGTAEVSKVFTLNVEQDNTPPEISSIPSPQEVTKNTKKTIQFTVSDAETPARNLVVTTVSGNTVLVPDANVSDAVYLGDSAVPNYQIEITPVTDREGNASLTIRASDGIDMAETTFTLLVVPGDGNTPPEIIGSFPARHTNEDEDEVIKFTIFDYETPVADLDVDVYSDKKDLVPDENILLERSGDECTVTIDPMENQNGSVNITVEVSDGRAVTTVKFPLEIISINDRPTITPHPQSQALELGENPDAVRFAVYDAETLTDDLIITISSSDSRLIPDENIYLDCTNGACVLMLITAKNQSGTSEITLSVDDGEGDNNSRADASFFISVGDVLPGDLDGNLTVDLRDAILAVKVLAGIPVSVIQDADVNGDGRIGMAEASYVLQDVAKR